MFRFAVGAAVAVVLALCVMSLAAVAQAATPPTLSGEAFNASESVSNPPYPFFLVCGNGFTSGPSFSVAGTASGPYPGPFSEVGTIEYNPTTLNNAYPFGEGPVTSFSATFTIDSPNGLVTGSETLVPTGAPAVCWESAGGGGVDIGWCNGYGDNPGPPVCPIKNEYTATIVTSTGTYHDQGTSSVELGESIGLGQYWNAVLKDAFTSVPPPLTLSNLTATVSGSTVNVSVDTSPAIVNVTLEEGGAKVAPDTTPVNGVASWTLTDLAPGTHTLAVQGWDSPSGQPGHHSGVQTFVVTVPPPPPPPSPTPQPTPNPAPTPSEPTSPPSSLGGSTPPTSSTPAAPIRLLLPSKLGIAGLLRQGGYTWALKAPTAGRVVVTWYRSGRLIAVGRARFTKLGPVTVRIRLTASGRRLLRHARSVRLTASATYMPTRGSAVSVTRVLRLLK